MHTSKMLARPAPLSGRSLAAGWLADARPMRGSTALAPCRIPAAGFSGRSNLGDSVLTLTTTRAAAQKRGQYRDFEQDTPDLYDEGFSLNSGFAANPDYDFSKDSLIDTAPYQPYDDDLKTTPRTAGPTGQRYPPAGQRYTAAPGQRYGAVPPPQPGAFQNDDWLKKDYGGGAYEYPPLAMPRPGGGAYGAPPGRTSGGGGGGYIGNFGGSYSNRGGPTYGSRMGALDDDLDDYGPQRPLPAPAKEDRVVNGKMLLCNTDILNVKEVRLQGPEREVLGIVRFHDALAMAQNQGVDLVLVNETQSPPICRLINWSKYKYEVEKGGKDKKKKSVAAVQELKEVRLGPKTDIGDVTVKTKQAAKFLEKGNKLKVTMKFEGRELQFKEQGKALLLKFIEDLAAFGKVDGPVNFKSGTFSAILSPVVGKTSGQSQPASPSPSAAAAAAAVVKPSVLPSPPPTPSVPLQPQWTPAAARPLRPAGPAAAPAWAGSTPASAAPRPLDGVSRPAMPSTPPNRPPTPSTAPAAPQRPAESRPPMAQPGTARPQQLSRPGTPSYSGSGGVLPSRPPMPAVRPPPVPLTRK